MMMVTTAAGTHHRREATPRPSDSPLEFKRYLAACREKVLVQIETLAASGDDGPLPSLILEYPLRPAKGLRPALCIATCRALGGYLDAVLPSAAVLELFHNAFLVHDDVEDGSEMRRGAPTLHREHGVPIAVNVGDAMLALALQPLLDNVELVGIASALEVLQVVATMCRHSVEGQALELHWIRHHRWDLTESDYVHMVEKKTGWYTFIAPVRVGALLANAQPAITSRLESFARALGTAFQIQDDLLNLEETRGYGKELEGDLYEGKRTLILLFALERAGADRGRMLEILAKPRCEKRPDDIAFLRAVIRRTGATARARHRAQRDAQRARELLDSLLPELGASPHANFLEALVDYVHTRSR